MAGKTYITTLTVPSGSFRFSMVANNRDIFTFNYWFVNTISGLQSSCFTANLRQNPANILFGELDSNFLAFARGGGAGSAFDGSSNDALLNNTLKRLLAHLDC